jgi:hypothetical protein
MPVNFIYKNKKNNSILTTELNGPEYSGSLSCTVKELRDLLRVTPCDSVVT